MKLTSFPSLALPRLPRRSPSHPSFIRSFFLSEGPGNNFSGPPLVSFLLTLRPLIPGLSVKPSLQTPWPRLISLVLLLLAPAEKIHNAYGADLSKIPQALLSGQAVDKAGLSLVGELVPIVTSVVAGGVEYCMRGLHQGVDALEGKKYPVKGA